MQLELQQASVQLKVIQLLIPLQRQLLHANGCNKTVVMDRNGQVATRHVWFEVITAVPAVYVFHCHVVPRKLEVSVENSASIFRA
jgi:hypothetical protein